MVIMSGFIAAMLVMTFVSKSCIAFLGNMEKMMII